MLRLRRTDCRALLRPVRLTHSKTQELTVIQRICGPIIEVINIIAEFLSCIPIELTENEKNNNYIIEAVRQVTDRLDLASAAA